MAADKNAFSKKCHKHKDTLLKKRKPNSIGSQKMDPNVIFQPQKNETNGLKTIFFLQNLHQSFFETVADVASVRFSFSP